MPATQQQVKSALNALITLAEAIREAKRIPNGHLYAAVSGHMDLDTFESFINKLVSAKLVRRERHNVLAWCGPTILTLGESC